MKWRAMMFLVTMAAWAGWVSAEPQRTLFTKENKFPEVRHTEVGAVGRFVETIDNDEQVALMDANQYVLTPYVRHQIAQDLTLLAELPFGRFEPDFGDNESGLGNLGLGVDLRAYENFFRYPYIIPHMMVKLNTGDEDVRIDGDEHSVLLGLSAGTVVATHFNFVGDISYEVFEDSENVASLAASVVWDVSSEFAFIGEIKVEDQELEEYGEEGKPFYFLGGISYEINEAQAFQVYGGGAANAPDDVIGAVKYSYSF